MKFYKVKFNLFLKSVGTQLVALLILLRHLLQQLNSVFQLSLSFPIAILFGSLILFTHNIHSAQTGIRAGHATDLWRTAISDVGASAHFCFKSYIRGTRGVKPDVAWRAVSDAVFSLTFFPVIVVGQMVQASPPREIVYRAHTVRKVREKVSKIWLGQGVKESPEIF